MGHRAALSLTSAPANAADATLLRSTSIRPCAHKMLLRDLHELMSACPPIAAPKPTSREVRVGPHAVIAPFRSNARDGIITIGAAHSECRGPSVEGSD